MILSVGPQGQGQDEVVVVTEITSSEKRVANLLEGDILLKNWRALGLTSESVLRCRQFQSLSRQSIAQRIGTVSQDLLAEAKAIAREIVA